ncbi:ATPase P [Marinicauda salina]|uniref:ATPase P n=1 Tax=Marinicauda salina TaxID=2135793 RepID=A0A2U2BWY1_9PROT|nr:cation-transporting P-type ATPase [Marinicauda salina]PWE18512.1 ATPase P [Marinicauda salina]
MADREAAAAERPVRWHGVDPGDAAGRLAADLDAGLSEAEARDRLAEAGPNEIEAAESFSILATLGRQLADPLILLLIAGVVLAAALGERFDAIMIAAIVVLNAALGFFQEWRAERALAALEGMLAPACNVVRDGERRRIDARELVPGDLVEMHRGERAPADLKLASGEGLLADESALTGEAHAVAKAPGADPDDAPVHARASILFAGSLLLDGRGRGVVVATGDHTEFGRIAALAASVRRQATPLQRRLARLSRVLGAAAVVAAVLVAALGLLAGRDPLEMLFTGVSLAVATVPEGLPAVVALSLALGVRKMAKRNALVRRLRGAETLGSATVICTDKTGTLTTGEMSAVSIVTAAGETDLSEGEAPPDALEVDALRTAGLCNDAELAEDGGVAGEPTERALLAAAHRFDAVDAEGPPRVAEQPFSAERKRMLVVVERDGELHAHMKGAPDYVLPLCAQIRTADGVEPLDDAGRRRWIDRAEEMGEAGLRVLAVAHRDTSADRLHSLEEVEREMVFLGLIGLMDPPRPRARPAMEAARAAGIRVVMITGDAAGTARAIAREVGLDATEVLSGAEIDGLDDAALAERLERRPVLSRTTPEHKLRVVRLLQDGGDIVAMTGDGVNDAPALKQADIGVAMGIRGVDAARAAADMVLLDDDFGTIVDAVREGRRQDESIRNFARFLLASNFGEVVAVAANVVTGAPLILTPVQLLWVNLLTDGPIALALGVERAGPDLMARPPRRPGARVLDRTAFMLVAVFGGWLAAVTLATFQHLLPAGAQTANAASFSAVVVMSCATVFVFRSLETPNTRLGWFSNQWLVAAVAATLAVQLALVYAPPLQRLMEVSAPPAMLWLGLGAAALPVLIVPEIVKSVRGSKGAALREG